MKRVLILGGSGFIGKSLSKILIEDNYEVYVITRNLKKNSNFNIKYVLKREQDIIKLINNNTYIINLAGENIGKQRWTKKVKEKILNSRIEACSFLERIIKKSKERPKAYIQASAVGYYGNRGKEKINEYSKKGIGFLSDVCDKWEKATEYLQEMNIRRVIIRSSMVLGISGGVLPQILKTINRFMSLNIYRKEQYLSWIHIIDEVYAIKFLIETENAQGIFNLCAPEPILGENFYNKISKLKKSIFKIKIPEMLVKLLLKDFAEELLLSSIRCYPERLLEAGFKFRYETIDKALYDLIK